MSDERILTVGGEAYRKLVASIPDDVEEGCGVPPETRCLSPDGRYLPVTSRPRRQNAITASSSLLPDLTNG